MCIAVEYFRPWFRREIEVFHFLTFLSQDKILDLSKFKAYDDIFKRCSNFDICIWYFGEYCGKRRKCWQPAFSPLSFETQGYVIYK